MKHFISSVSVLLSSPAFSAIEVEPEQAVTGISYEHILNWSFGLIIVLGLFFVCVWFIKKAGVLPANSKDNMRVLSALSLGAREKIVLVQVGDKQLVLGVASGKIDKLLVLEGEERLFRHSEVNSTENEFSQKLKQIMSGTANE